MGTRIEFKDAPARVEDALFDREKRQYFAVLIMDQGGVRSSFGDDYQNRTAKIAIPISHENYDYLKEHPGARVEVRIVFDGLEIRVEKLGRLG